MYKRYKIKNSKLILNFWLSICIILFTCFLSIGYAEIISTDLNVNLNANATAYMGMFISNVEYVSDNGADLTNSQIIDYTETMLHSNIYLSSSDTSSSITYAVTICNNSDSIKKFIGVTYLDDAYSNEDITYSLDGLNINDTIEKGSSKTFNITFYYDNISTITNNELDSYLNFKFDYYLEGEVEVDIYITSAESYTFAGVTADNPISLQNIANISFMVKNASGNVISGIKVDVTYTTSTGSKQSATVTLSDESDTVIATQTTQFLGKQTNTVVSTTFDDVNIEDNGKISIQFDKSTITNGQVSISNVTITPIF